MATEKDVMMIGQAMLAATERHQLDSEVVRRWLEDPTRADLLGAFLAKRRLIHIPDRPATENLAWVREQFAVQSIDSSILDEYSARWAALFKAARGKWYLPCPGQYAQSQFGAIHPSHRIPEKNLPAFVMWVLQVKLLKWAMAVPETREGFFEKDSISIYALRFVPEREKDLGHFYLQNVYNVWMNDMCVGFSETT